MKTNIYLITLLFSTILFAKDNYYYQGGKKVYLLATQEVKTYSLNEDTSSTTNIKYFSTSKNKIVGVTDEILLKIDDNTDINTILTKYDITLVKQLTQNLYVVSVKDSTTILDTANRLYEDTQIKFAHPNFIRKIDKR